MKRSDFEIRLTPAEAEEISSEIESSDDLGIALDEAQALIRLGKQRRVSILITVER